MPIDELPKRSLTNPQDVLLEIFDSDEWVKKEFSIHFSADLLAFSEVVAKSIARYPELHALIGEDDEQAMYVCAFVHGIFDDLITSTKLLVTGKLIPSGNLMRQALEGIAVAALCSSRGLLLIPKHRKKGSTTIQVNYWKLVKDADERVESHMALRHLELNRIQLGFSGDAIDELKRGVKAHHPMSHPSLQSLGSRVRETETGIMQFVGGVFNDEMVPIYAREIQERTNLCRVLPSLFDLVLMQLKAKS